MTGSQACDAAPALYIVNPVKKMSFSQTWGVTEGFFKGGDFSSEPLAFSLNLKSWATPGVNVPGVETPPSGGGVDKDEQPRREHLEG